MTLTVITLAISTALLLLAAVFPVGAQQLSKVPRIGVLGAQALGPSGEIIGQDLAWLGTLLTPGMRAYFEVPVSESAPTYRVSVFAFDWVMTDGPQRRHRF